MLEQLKREVWKANLNLVKRHLVILTFGNASGIDRKTGLVVIKPSGVPYHLLKPNQMSIVDLSGKLVEKKYKPSMDTPTHLALYRAWPEIGGVCHTHSRYAVAFSQAGLPIPCLGTTQGDHFYGAIPVTRMLTKAEVKTDYEKNTGKAILKHFDRINPLDLPGILVMKHGPFTWGKDAMDAVSHSLLLEEIAKTALATILLNPKTAGLPKYILDAHFRRKHGDQARYGQKH